MIFLTTALVVLVACMSPGPDFFMVSRTAIVQGTRAGVLCALGIAAGCFVYAALAVLGLDMVFRRFEGLALLVRVGGALYLGWLAFQVWQSAASPLPAAGSLPQARSAFRLGLFTNLTNPKAIAFFSSVFAFALTPSTLPIAKAGLALTAFAVAALWFILVAVVLSRPAAQRRYARAKALIDRSCAAVMGVFAVRILVNARN